MTVRGASDVLRYIGALATVVVGVVHLQQYADFIHDVPTIGVLFALNAAGAGVVTVLLVARRAALGALGGLGLSLGALVSILISMSSSGLFDYREPTFRTAVVIAVIAEVIAVVSLLSYIVVRRLPTRPRVDWSPR